MSELFTKTPNEIGHMFTCKNCGKQHMDSERSSKVGVVCRECAADWGRKGSRARMERTLALGGACIRCGRPNTRRVRPDGKAENICQPCRGVADYDRVHGRDSMEYITWRIGCLEKLKAECQERMEQRAKDAEAASVAKSEVVVPVTAQQFYDARFARIEEAITALSVAVLHGQPKRN